MRHICSTAIVRISLLVCQYKSKRDETRMTNTMYLNLYFLLLYKQ